MELWNALARQPSALDALAADVVVLQDVPADDIDHFDGHLFVGPARADLPQSASTAGPSHHLGRSAIAGTSLLPTGEPAGEHVADLAAIWALTGRDVASYTEQFAAILSFIATRESTAPSSRRATSTPRHRVRTSAPTP